MTNDNLVTGVPPDAVILGKSVGMLELQRRLARLLATNLPIVLQGESGTGKEIVSKFIHNNSAGIDGAYVKINCVNDYDTFLELLPSTMVGGRDQANGELVLTPQIDVSGIGTLFLDEIAELSLRQQLQLLHLLPDRQDSENGNLPNPWAKARIIGSTGRDLRQEVKENRFRRELFYRLAVVILEVPPLRNRQDDLLLIADYLRQRYSENFGLPIIPLPPALLERMLRYGWPGNIRELENFICHYVVLGPEEQVLRELTGNGEGAATTETITPGVTLLREVARQTLVKVEREMIVKALELHGSLKQAASALGISYRTLMNKMDQVGLPRVRHVIRRAKTSSRADET